DGVLDAVQRQALDDAGQPEAVVAVEVGDGDVRDLAGGQPCQRHLPLRALAGVEHDAQLIPLQEERVVVALTRGHLTGGPEECDTAGGHRWTPILGRAACGLAGRATAGLPARFCLTDRAGTPAGAGSVASRRA